LNNEQAAPEPTWVVSSSPHLRDPESTPRIMWSVIAALTPAGVWGVYLFGWAALYVITLCVVTSVLTEAIIQKLRGKPVTVSDGSAALTGLLLAYCLPSHTIGPNGELQLLLWHVPVFGSIAAIAIAKQAFGGLGHNIWNPALIGRAFVQLAFAGHVSLAAWPWPVAGTVDAVTRATALSKNVAGYNLGDLFFGNCSGCIGEVSAFLLLVGAAYLIARKYVNWRLPLAYVLTLVVFATLFAWSEQPERTPWVNDFAKTFAALREGDIGLDAFLPRWMIFGAMEVFAGGVVLGAFYMATDMVTSPLSSRGQVVFGIGCGFLTALIRFYAGYPEGVCYSILLMNTVRPYVDRYTRPRILGERKEKNKPEGK